MEDNNKPNDLLIQQLVPVENVKLNLRQSVIVITEDKLKLKLHTHLATSEKRKDWIAPFSVLISLSLALLTADFKNIIFPQDTWKAAFIIATILTVAWLIVTLKQAFHSHSLESLIEEIKSETRVSNYDDSNGNIHHV